MLNTISDLFNITNYISDGGFYQNGIGRSLIRKLNISENRPIILTDPYGGFTHGIVDNTAKFTYNDDLMKNEINYIQNNNNNNNSDITNLQYNLNEIENKEINNKYINDLYFDLSKIIANYYIWIVEKNDKLFS